MPTEVRVVEHKDFGKIYYCNFYWGADEVGDRILVDPQKQKMPTF